MILSVEIEFLHGKSWEVKKRKMKGATPEREKGKGRWKIWNKLSNNQAYWLRMRNLGWKHLSMKTTDILCKLAKNENFGLNARSCGHGNGYKVHP